MEALEDPEVQVTITTLEYPNNTIRSQKGSEPDLKLAARFNIKNNTDNNSDFRDAKLTQKMARKMLSDSVVLANKVLNSPKVIASLIRRNRN